MLVLSRKRGEIVDMILDGVVIATVTFLDQKGGDVRLGFEARPEVVILRRELDRRRADRRAAP
jgi:carbon storage regulator CsrA